MYKNNSSKGVTALLISNSTQQGSSYLEHCAKDLVSFFKGCKKIAFVPYAGSDHNAYSEKVEKAFKYFNLPPLHSIHTYQNQVEFISECDGIFVGGGNTFRLVSQLYKFNLIHPIRNRVLSGDLKYVGSSAGTNVAGLTIKTTNDMPIIYPPSFDSLGIVPIQINPHFLDGDKLPKNMGETREQRIKNFHEENDTVVIALREGAMLLITEGHKMIITGQCGGKLFEKLKEPKELTIGDDLSHLLLK